MRDSLGVESGHDKGAAQAGRWPDQAVRVRCEALRSREQQLDAGLFENGMAMNRLFDVGSEVVPVLGQAGEREVIGKLGAGQRLGFGFEPADEQAPDLVARVNPGIMVPSDRQLDHAVDLLGHEIAVRHGVKRHTDSRQTPNVAGPRAAGEHHDFAGDPTLVGDHCRDLR